LSYQLYIRSWRDSEGEKEAGRGKEEVRECERDERTREGEWEKRKEGEGERQRMGENEKG